VKLFSKNSNLCDHNSPTLQTDRQTDRRHVIAIPRFALKCIAVKTDDDSAERVVVHMGRVCGGVFLLFVCRISNTTLSGKRNCQK